MNKKYKARVRCELVVDVEIAASSEEDVRFMIEENSCPGTGKVGAAIDAMIQRCDELSVCWACNFKGENKIESLEEA